MRTPAAAPPAPSLIRGLTLLGAVALVVGNMVGTSTYTLAASLANETGPLGILAWAVTAAGYLFVALVYARLGVRYPVTGGPYEYARRAFGPFVGFQAVWAYWLSAVIGNAGIITAVMGYAVGLWAPLERSTALQFAVAQTVLWGLCALNVRGVRHSSRLQVGIMILTAVPLLLVAIGLLAHFDAANLRPFAPKGFGTLATGVALVVWAYSGVESATVPAEEVDRPERTIGLGTMLGYGIATLMFLAAAVGVAGSLPNAVVAASGRPLALAAETHLGALPGLVITLAAVVAGTGTLNGWILMAGRIPLTAAREGWFFSVFQRVHPRYGTPHVALIAGTAISSAMLVMFFSRTLITVFNFIALLSVLLTLVPHLLASLAELVLARRDPERYSPRARRAALVTAPVAAVFICYAIWGVGVTTALWGLAGMALGLPLYAWFARSTPAAEVAL